MALYQPGLPACSTCQKYFVDWDWEKETGTGEVLRNPAGEPEERTGPPPCSKCPKESPDKEHLHVLSDKNWKTFDFYQLGKATSGACFTPQMLEDGVLRQNLALIERIMQGYERRQLAETILGVPRV